MFKEEIILEDERVRLQALKSTDFNVLLPFSEQEPELWTYSLVSGAGAENLKKHVALAIQSRENGNSYPFLVIDKQTNDVAGSTRFYDYQPVHQTVQLGFTWYGKKFQGTGLNDHCKFLLLQFAFEKLDIQRIEFRADYKNKKSIAAMRKLGCTEEGVLRSNCNSPTGRRDSIVLSILKSEWLEQIKGQLLLKL